MLGSSGETAQLAACQGGLSSMRDDLLDTNALCDIHDWACDYRTENDMKHVGRIIHACICKLPSPVLVSLHLSYL
jgi:hypothetical protein